jgi:hypothetical protein
MVWKTSDFHEPESSALSDEVSLRECSSNDRVFLGGSGRHHIKSILDRELGLRKFTHRRMPHILSVEQKLRKVTESQSLLTILANLAEKNFQGIITGDES